MDLRTGLIATGFVLSPLLVGFLGYIFSRAPRFFGGCLALVALWFCNSAYAHSTEITDEMGLKWLATTFLLVAPSFVIAFAIGDTLWRKVARWCDSYWGGSQTTGELWFATIGIAVIVRVIDQVARHGIRW